MVDIEVGSVKALIIADGSQFSAAMKKSAADATANGRVRELAARKAAEAEALSAKFAGTAIQEKTLLILQATKDERTARADLKRATDLQKVAQDGDTAAANLAAAAYQRLNAVTEERIALLRGEAAGEEGVSKRMAASAAVRGLETGNVGIRAVENFITSVPGVGAALQNVFPLIGAAAFIGALVEGGQKLYELEQKGKHAAGEIAAAFDELTTKQAASNDSIELTNSKLEDQIAKLEHHPNNGLKTALLEAVVAADKLQAALAGDIKELDTLLKQNSVSRIEGLLSNVASTGGAEKEIATYGQQVKSETSKAKAELSSALTLAGPDTAKQEAATRAYYGRIDAITAEAARHMRARAAEIAADQARADAQVRSTANEGTPLSGLSGVAAGMILKARGATDRSAVRSDFEGSAEVYDEAQRSAQDLGRNAQLERRKGSDEGARDQGRDTAAAAAKAEAARRKAAEQLLHSMEAEFAAEKLVHSLSLKDEFDFWGARLDLFAKGSEQYNRVLEMQASIAQQGRAKVAAEVGKLRNEQRRDLEEDAKANLQVGSATAFIQRSDRQDARDTAKSGNELHEQEQLNAAKLAALGIDEAAGRSLTRQNALLALAAVHAAEYNARMELLVANLQRVQQNGDLTPDEKTRQTGQAERAIGQAQADRSVQQQQDQFAIAPPPTDALVGAREALDQFKSSTLDAAKAMASLTSDAISRTNDSIVRALTLKHGERTDFGAAGADIARNVAAKAVQSGEGNLINMAETNPQLKGLLDKLGLGKKSAPLGTSSDPLHVMLVPGTGATSDSSGGLGSLIAGAAGGSTPWTAGAPSADMDSGAGASSLMQIFNGGGEAGEGGSGAAIGSTIGTLAKFAMMIPGFADGVDGFGGGLAVVGERGPEMVHLPRGSTVMPNHKLSQAIGGAGSNGGDTHYHIDASGSQDPAATEAAVHRGIVSGISMSAQMAASLSADRARRVPLTKAR